MTKVITMNSNYNKATTFVRPLLGLSNECYTNNYHNCYVTTDDGEIMIHLVFYNVPEDQLNDKQKETFDMLNSDPSLKEKSIYSKYLILSFKADSDVASDVNRFLEGKYSLMSDGGKQMILFSQYDDKNVDAISSILYPTKDDRIKLSKALDVQLPDDAEVFSKPDLKEELLDISTLC